MPTRSKPGTNTKATKKRSMQAELKETLGAVTKRYGGNSVHMANEILQPSRISTGAFTLDFALLGGIPDNRITMIVGERHSGKSMLSNRIITSAQNMYPDQTPIILDIEGCIAGSTLLVDSTTGIVHTAKELYEGKIKASLMSYDEKDNTLKPSKVIAWFDNGIKDTYRVQAGSTSIEVTDNHKMLVARSTGEYEWVRCGELKEGDYICRPYKYTESFSHTCGVTEEESELLGNLIGDGSYGKSNTSVVFTKKDKEVISRVSDLCEYKGIVLVQFSDRHYRLSKDSNVPKYNRRGTNRLIELLKDVGIWGQSGSSKVIPSVIMKGTKDVITSMLTGLYNTDGGVSKVRPTITFTNTSWRLVHQVQYLWTRLGIPSTIHRYSDDDDNHNDWYTISINSVRRLQRVYKLLNLVGIRDDTLYNWSVQSLRSTYSTSRYSMGYKVLTDSERKEAREGGTHLNETGMYFVKVTSIEPTGRQNTYDFTIEGTHNYVANGLVVHNTFESTWAKKLGVDLDSLPVIPCDTGEMAADVGAALVESKGTSLLVVDSIAALVPMKEVESSAEDAHVGLQARLVGSFIRKITSSLIKERRRGHYVTVLFLNQFRLKIGVSFGDPRTLPGGKALEFATSVQIIIKNKENKGRSSVGIETLTHNDHSYTITKNKLNNGPRTGEFILLREDDEESGLLAGMVDDSITVLSFAKKFGLYTGGGTRWTLEFGETKVSFGKAKEAIQALQDDQVLYWALRTHIIRMQADRLGMPTEFIKRIK